MHTIACEKIKSAGFEPPMMVYWNVRCDTIGMPSEPDANGALLVSGYSPSIFQQISSGQAGEEVLVNENTVDNDDPEEESFDDLPAKENNTRRKNPIEHLYDTLNDPRYNEIGEACEDAFKEDDIDEIISSLKSI